MKTKNHTANGIPASLAEGLVGNLTTAGVVPLLPGLRSVITCFPKDAADTAHGL